jgi:translation initiation factor 1
VKHKPAGKINTEHEHPLSQNPFGALSGLDLPPGPETVPAAAAAPAKPAKLGRVVLRRETAERGGKTVVVAGDFAPEHTGAQIEEWCRDVKRHCGCGGTVRGREIEIQGDQAARVAARFEAIGFRVAGVRS